MTDIESATPSPQPEGPYALGTALKAYLLAQLGLIVEHLRRQGPHPHNAVHETRKAVRRFRSVAALCEAAAPEILQAAGLRIRGIGKKLSRLRDAHVATETAAAQRRQSADAALWREAQDALKAARNGLREQMLANDPAFGRLRRRARRTSRQIEALDFATLDADAILQGLQASAARMRKAERRAGEKPQLAQRHRWRRRVRRLRLQLECLQQIADDEYNLPGLRAQARRILAEAEDTLPADSSLAALADRLGGQQDLVNLRTALRRLDGLAQRDALLKTLRLRRNETPVAARRISAARTP